MNDPSLPSVSLSGSGPDATAPATVRDDQTLTQDDAQQERSRELSRAPLETPPAIAGYEIFHRLGEGSFGAVWLAREKRTGKHVAIKFYTRGQGVDWSLLSREVEKLAVLYTSRKIVGLLDVGWDHDPPYFVMEYLENGSLATKLKDGPLNSEQTVRIARSVGEALVHAHGAGILHCDLKPANVLIDGNSDARLGDFGQSRLATEMSPALGTLYYMAPEQASLDGIPDARWDVYSLGAVMFHMLTGHPPYRTPEAERTIARAPTTEGRLAAYREVIAASPRPEEHRLVKGVDSRLADIVDRCLERDAAHRIANAQVVLDLLEARDTARAKRPLVVLGALGPVLFLIAMYWISRVVAPSIVHTAEQQLLDQALAGDAVSARILASSIAQEIQIREDELVDAADWSYVRQIIRESAQHSRDELMTLNKGDYPVAEQQLAFDKVKTHIANLQDRLKTADRTRDESWFMTDTEGRQIFRYPDSGESLSEHYHWRDYYHGLGEELDRDVPYDKVSPRKTTGVSLAYFSTSSHKYKVSIATPVWDEEKRTVLGVMARSVHITDLLKQWEPQIGKEGRPEDRFLSLVETRGRRPHLLDHLRIEDTLAKITAQEEQHMLRVSPEVEKSLETTDRMADYRDPIAEVDPSFDGPWLAAFSPVGETGWTAIVQERRNLTLEPLGKLQGVLTRGGLWALGVFSVLLGVLWYLLHRASV